MAQTQNTLPRLAEPRAVETSNPFGEVTPARTTGGLVAVEQQRAIAEVQAAMIVAQRFPRDPIKATDLILNDCTRPTLAEKAIFSFARGGTEIEGPTIRLLEAIAQRWGNIQTGVREIVRHEFHSECEAFAWDAETNFRDVKQFQIRHWRDTKQGGYRITDERDIYELIANMGQRRKRAAMQAVIPGDVIEAALEQCAKTAQAKADTSPEAMTKMLSLFAEHGVSQSQIEARIQRRLDAIRPAQVLSLRKIYNSIRDGMSEPGDWFGDVATEAPAARGEDTPREQPERPHPQRVPRGRPRKTSPVEATGVGDVVEQTSPAPEPQQPQPRTGFDFDV